MQTTTTNDFTIISKELDSHFCYTEYAGVDFGGHEFLVQYNPQTKVYFLYARTNDHFMGKLYEGKNRNKAIMVLLEYVESKKLS